MSRTHLSARHRYRLFVARHRRVLAAVLVAVGTLLSIAAARPSPEPTVPVLVADHDLAAGQTLAPDDVRVVRVPASVVPAGALRGGTTDGRVVAGAMRAGEMFTDRRVVGASLVEGFPRGTVAAPVRIADPDAVRMLRVGDRVNVYAASERRRDDGPLVAAATVVALPQPDVDASGEGLLVVLAVSSQQADLLTDAAATTVLGVATLPG